MLCSTSDAGNGWKYFETPRRCAGTGQPRPLSRAAGHRSVSERPHPRPGAGSERDPPAPAPPRLCREELWMRPLRHLALLQALVPLRRQNRHQQLRFHPREGWGGESPLQLGTGSAEQTQTMLSAGAGSSAGFQGKMR